MFFLATRLYKISRIPDSVYWDEASIGYNAYSIGTDLKDEWGETLPVHFRAFGEFKLPVYIYSTVPFVKIFGLNAFSVRIPAVLYSLGSLILVYFLALYISKNIKTASWSAFIFSITPWMFIFSRTGYEANAGLFFLLLSIYLFLHSLKNNIFYLIALISGILSMYSYTSFRIIFVLIFPIFCCIYLYKNFKKRIVYVLLSVFIFSVSLIPIVRLYLFDAGFQRAQVFTLIPTFQRVFDLSGKPHLQLTYNRSQNINWWNNVYKIGKNYLSHFALDFLVFKGDSNPRSQIPNHGQLFLLDIPLVIGGLYISFIFIRKKEFKYAIPIGLLLLSPIPAAINNESPHALRTILAAPSFSIIIAFGIEAFAKVFKNKSGALFIVLGMLYMLFFGEYFHDFLTNYQNQSANDWQYEYKKIFLESKSGTITDRYGQPYIFALFYQKYPSSEFRQTVEYNPVSDWGFSLVKSFGEYQFIKYEK